MPTLRRSLQILSVLPLLALGACGEGYETRPYSGTPYDGNQPGERTAGYGVEYVLAKMMPEKGPVLETQMKEETVTVTEEPEPAPVEAAPPPPVEDAAPVFNEMQRK